MPKTKIARMANTGFAIAAIALMPLLSACGSDDSGASSGSVTVTMGDDLRFHEQRIEVEPGATIEWHNDGEVPHDVVARSGASFRSPLVRAGEHYETTLEQAGTVAYVCTLHPGMEGEIVVRAG